jgi:hypothetical protein
LIEGIVGVVILVALGGAIYFARQAAASEVEVDLQTKKAGVLRVLARRTRAKNLKDLLDRVRRRRGDK